MYYKLIGIFGYLIYFLGFPLILEGLWPINISNSIEIIYLIEKIFFIFVIVLS